MKVYNFKEILKQPHILQLLKQRYFMPIPEEIYEEYGGSEFEGEFVESWYLLAHRVALKMASALFVDELRNKRSEAITDEKLYEEFLETYEEFFDNIYELKYLPSSPMMFNALKGFPDKEIVYKDVRELKIQDVKDIANYVNNKAGYGSCYSMGLVEDSLEGIFQQSLYEQAVVFKGAGGFGVNFSNLRSKDAPVRTIEGNSSGACSFVDYFDLSTKIIALKSKHKRGANMFLLSSEHPEIYDFVNAKRDFNKWTKGNISVWTSHEFMNNLKNKRKHILRDPAFKEIQQEIDPANLWSVVVKNAVETAEPAFIFEGNIEDRNMFKGIEKINSVNPCAEYVNIDKTVCTLGSVNIYAFVEKDGSFDYKGFEKATYSLAKFLSYSIYANEYPLDILTTKSRAYNPIGLGFMGYATALTYYGFKYGEKKANTFLKSLTETQLDSCIRMSQNLAEIYRPFDRWEQTETAKTGKWYNTDKTINKPLFNSRLMAIAPTGSISFIAGVSSGIEPVFFWNTERRINPDMKNEYKVNVEDLGLKDYYQKIEMEIPMQEIDGKEFVDSTKLPSHCVTTQQLDLFSHLAPLKIVSDIIDMSISKTFNIKGHYTKQEWEEAIKVLSNAYDFNYEEFPKLDFDFGDNYVYQIVSDFYYLTWLLGIRGTSIYVDGSRIPILTDASKKEEVLEDEFSNFTNNITNFIKKNEEKVKSNRQKIFYKLAEDLSFEENGEIKKIVVEISIDENREPFELFLIPKNKSFEKSEMLNITGRLFSFLLRNNVPIDIPLKQMRKVKNSKNEKSFLFNIIADTIEKLIHIAKEQNTFQKAKEISLKEEDVVATAKGYLIHKKTNKKICPDCFRDGKEGNIVMKDGCVECVECGWTACN